MFIYCVYRVERDSEYIGLFQTPVGVRPADIIGGTRWAGSACKVFHQEKTTQACLRNERRTGNSAWSVVCEESAIQMIGRALTVRCASCRPPQPVPSHITYQVMHCRAHRTHNTHPSASFVAAAASSASSVLFRSISHVVGNFTARSM